METLGASEAKTRFGELLDIVQREPVRIARRDRVVGVMVSVQDQEAMRAFYADRQPSSMPGSHRGPRISVARFVGLSQRVGGAGRPALKCLGGASGAARSRA